MKRLIYVLLLLAASLQVGWAQNNADNIMVVEGAQWFYYFKFTPPGEDVAEISPITFFFDGDTVINEKTYLKCYRTVYKPVRALERIYPYNNIIILFEAGTKLVACLRETEYHEVYARYERSYREEVRGFCVTPYGFLNDPEFDEGEYVIYQINNGSNMYRDCPLTIHMHEHIFNFDTYDTVEINGKQFARETNTPANELEEITYGHHYLIPPIGYYAENSSGVGQLSTFLSPLAFPREYFGMINVFCTFSHYSMNGEVQYKSKWYKPEELWSSVEEVKASKPDDGRWYNLQGQAFDEPAAPGVYIHNGTKVEVK